MWQPIVANNCNYLIKCKANTVFVTDFQAIWSEDVLDDVLLPRFKDLNPLLHSKSLTFENAQQKVLSLINETTKLRNVKLTKHDANIVLELKRNLSDSNIPLCYTFDLSAGDTQTFFEEFTLPLMQTVQHLEVKQKKLIELLENKDKEIQEHELGGSELSRRSLVTTKFDAKSALEQVPEQLLINVFAKSKSFLEIFVQKYGAVFKVARKMGENKANPEKKLKVDNM